MRLSLSVRIAEGFLSKEEAVLDLEEVCEVASEAGFEAICMRASQVGVHSKAEAVQQAVATLKKFDLPVSMVTGDFATVYNNAQGPDSLRNITPFLDLAEALGSSLIRVALKEAEDIVPAQRAADEARERGITLAHQCHCLSLFETLDAIESTLRAIDRPNFGLIYEAANLEECGQDYGPASIRRLAPWMVNVYLQNQRMHPEGAVTLETWCRGPVKFDIIPIAEEGGIDYAAIFRGLREIDYQGTITVHQSGPEEGPSTAVDEARETARFLRGLMEDV
jgi:sugar phosphate isomerase/epimerase